MAAFSLSVLIQKVKKNVKKTQRLGGKAVLRNGLSWTELGRG